MQITQELKIEALVHPASLSSATSWTNVVFDSSIGSEFFAEIHFGAVGQTLSALKLVESEASDLSGATDIPGADFSAATLPTTSYANKYVGIYVGSKAARKRYWGLVATNGGTGATVLEASMITGSLGQLPYDALTAGLQELLTVN